MAHSDVETGDVETGDVKTGDVKTGDLNTAAQILEPPECMELLATEEIGRLAVVVDGLPEIFPVNYAVDDGTIVFRTDLGTKLLGASHRPVVFEVDRFDRAARSAWSVVLHGRADPVSDIDSARMRHRISQLELYPWTGTDKPYVLRVVPTTVTGRRVTARALRPSLL